MLKFALVCRFFRALPLRYFSACTLALALCGCVSIVEVRTNDAPPKLSLYPFGVNVERGENDTAIDVSALSLGAVSSCYTAGFGILRTHCALVDPRACAAALIRSGDPAALDWWGRIAAEAEAFCPHKGDHS
jgi:hypothetical protein